VKKKKKEKKKKEAENPHTSKKVNKKPCAIYHVNGWN